MTMGVDRLSALPNSVLSLILSKLPIKDAIKCSVLSKTWRFLYTEIQPMSSHINARSGFPHLLSIIENRIFDILRLHSLDLDSFALYISAWTPVRQFTHKSLSEWMRCVATKNVKRLFLESSSQMETPPPSLFSCTTLTLLKINTCILTTFPTDFAGFKHLTECNLNYTQMTDDSLARFLSHCPLLHKFNLRNCTGLERPVISSPNLTELVLELNRPQQLIVKCPKLKTLKTNECIQDLRVNGMEFYEISSTIESLQMEGGSNLMELSLRSRAFGEYNFSVNRFLEILGTLRSLKVLSIYFEKAYRPQNGIGMAVPLFNLLSRLPNLEHLHLGGGLVLAEAEAEAEGEGDPVLQCLTYRLVNLQMVEIDVHKYDANELGLLGCLLQIAPALKEVKLRAVGGRENRKSFFKSWESLKKSREQGTMPEKEKYLKLAFIFMVTFHPIVTNVYGRQTGGFI